jgi:hypothetical protein
MLCIWGPFFISEDKVTAAICLDVLQVFCFPQLDETRNPDAMFQQDVSETLRGRIKWQIPREMDWQRRTDILACCSPGLTPLDFFYVRPC